MVVVIMMMVCMIVRVAVAMLVMIVIMIGVSMTVGMSMSMIVSMIMLVVAMAVIVQGMRRRDRGADRCGAMERAQRREEDPPFHPQQPDADEDDERIAQDFDQIDRPFHVAAVAFNNAAAMPTSTTATSACNSADANDNTTPRTQVSSFATM